MTNKMLGRDRELVVCTHDGVGRGRCSERGCYRCQEDG